MALLLSSLNVFYRDVGSITEVLLSAWFSLTPIIYPVDLAQNKLSDILRDNFGLAASTADSVWSATDRARGVGGGAWSGRPRGPLRRP